MFKQKLFTCLSRTTSLDLFFICLINYLFRIHSNDPKSLSINVCVYPGTSFNFIQRSYSLFYHFFIHLSAVFVKIRKTMESLNFKPVKPILQPTYPRLPPEQTEVDYRNSRQINVCELAAPEWDKPANCIDLEWVYAKRDLRNVTQYLKKTRATAAIEYGKNNIKWHELQEKEENLRQSFIKFEQVTAFIYRFLGVVWEVLVGKVVWGVNGFNWILIDSGIKVLGFVLLGNMI